MITTRRYTNLCLPLPLPLPHLVKSRRRTVDRYSSAAYRFRSNRIHHISTAIAWMQDIILCRFTLRLVLVRLVNFLTLSIQLCEYNAPTANWVESAVGPRLARLVCLYTNASRRQFFRRWTVSLELSSCRIT